MKHIPNMLTVLRIIITVAFVMMFLKLHIFSAFMLFILASITDYFDGYCARKYQLVTSFGKIMDPIADKFLILSAFGVFAFVNIMPWWIFIIIALREISVTVFRFVAMYRGKVLAAEKAGKAKTVIQITTICLMLVLQMISVYWGESFFASFMNIGVGLAISVVIGLGLSVVITLGSGVLVFWNNRALLSKQEGILL